MRVFASKLAFNWNLRDSSKSSRSNSESQLSKNDEGTPIIGDIHHALGKY